MPARKKNARRRTNEWVDPGGTYVNGKWVTWDQHKALSSRQMPTWDRLTPQERARYQREWDPYYAEKKN